MGRITIVRILWTNAKENIYACFYMYMQLLLYFVRESEIH